MPIATRLTNTGTLLVNGIFDENTSIAPAKFRTTSTTVYAGSLDEVNNMIITNGLLLYVNGSSGVYSGSGTQWTDLSAYNNNATLTNSPTYSSTTGGGSFNFNGTSQFASVTPALLNTTYTGKTVFVVCRMSSAGWTPGVAQYRAMFGTSTGTRNFNFYVFHTAANTYQLHFSVSGSATTTTNVAIVPDTWMILAVTQDTTVTYYVNGVSVYSAAGQTLSQYAAGGNEAVARADNYWSGDIAVCSIYSRTLSSAEILNNYNAFASRVGLATSTISNRQNSDGTLNVNTQFDEFTGAPVVNSSLALWLDAGQSSSYSGTGTVWTDLSSSGYNFNYYNTPVFNSYPGSFTIGTVANSGFQSAVGSMPATETSTFSVEAWVKHTSFNSSSQYYNIISLRENYNVSGFRFGVATPNGLNTDTTGSPVFWTNQSGGNYSTSFSTYPITLNTWYQVIVTYDGTNFRVYFNGTLINTTAGTYVIPASRSYYIGTNVSGIKSLNGEISVFKWYSSTLTADEVTTNFNALRGRYGV